MELFPPIVANVMLVLIGVLSMVSLVGLAYNWTLVISERKQFNKIHGLEKSVSKLQLEVKELKERLAAEQLKDAVSLPAEAIDKPHSLPTPKQQEEQEIWREFLEDYNNLAASMHVPKAEQACQVFAEDHDLVFLICKDHAAQENGRTVPKFAAVQSLSECTYWAWPVKEAPGAYVVVPNPLVSYNQKLHTEGGMKETFASNYEQGTAETIQVRLPAKFQQQGDRWKIVQPGVIRVK